VPEPGQLQLDTGGVKLHIYTLGDTRRPPLVMLHGMRDVALSLLPVAQRLADDYQVLLPDLRGHGRSDKPGSYAMPDFIFDLHKLLEAVAEQPVALFGHSLGGQIATRFCAMYPDRVAAAVIVEGLGPPQRPFLSDPDTLLKIEGQRILDTLGQSASTRPLPDVEFAASRLLVNNPRLTPASAQALASQATTRDPQGNLIWAFDQRVSAVFLGSQGDSERYWKSVRCPVLLITGEHAGEYWSTSAPPGSDWNGRFAAGELEARLAMFRDHEHLAFEDSGHMVHFDEPERLAHATHDFLRRRYE
jgi:pimeloyl-ACP methyl ester carboxylesterase